MDRDIGRGEARRRAARTAIHDLDAHAGGEPETRFLDRADDAGAQRLFQEGAHLLSPHRLDDAEREGAGRVGRAPFARCSATSYYAGPRRYQTKVKNAQEAHEAIRPRISARRLQRWGVSTGDDFRLYELIWKRTMASQMVDARVLRTTVEITGTGTNGEAAVFTAIGQGDRVRRIPPRLRRGQRRSGGRTRGPGDDPAEARVGDAVVAAGRRRSATLRCSLSSRSGTRRRRPHATRKPR